jgi:hypothetical protein
MTCDTILGAINGYLLHAPVLVLLPIDQELQWLTLLVPVPVSFC